LAEAESQRAEEEHRAAAMIAMSIIAVIVFYFVH